MSQLKVYIWEISGRYGGGAAIAMAENVKQARRLVKEQAGKGECEDICERPTVVNINKCKPQAFYFYFEE